MQKITNYCDGCGKKLEGKKLQEAQDATKAFNKQQERTQTEIFCFDKCSYHSIAYWEQSGPVTLKALTDANAAVNNHRRKFFASRLSLKEVM